MDQLAFLLGIPQEFWPRPEPPPEETWEILEEVLATDLSGPSPQFEESQRFLEDFFDSRSEGPATVEASTQTDPLVSTIIFVQGVISPVGKARKPRVKSTKPRKPGKPKEPGSTVKTSSRLGRPRSTDLTVCFNCQWTKAECIRGKRPLMYSDVDFNFRCKACHTYHKAQAKESKSGERTSRKLWESRNRRKRFMDDPGDDSEIDA